jgi:hypothetical protein
MQLANKTSLGLMMNLMICIVREILCESGQMKENEIGGACSTRRRSELLAGSWTENRKEMKK